MNLRRVIFLLGQCALVLSAGAAGQAHAQADFVETGSDAGLTLKGYMAKAGPDAKLIAAGKLKIDKHRMACGRRPTVIDPKFDSWGGAYPGYLILNPDRLKGLATPVKLFVYAHECGHQFIGRDEAAADCFGIKRGRRYGWLKEEGLATDESLEAIFKEIEQAIDEAVAFAERSPSPEPADTLKHVFYGSESGGEA